MTRKTNLLALLGAAAVTVLAVASFSNAASEAVPVNTAPPKITGTSAEAGQTLSASSGTWTSASTITFKYQWRRCNAQGNGCSNIGGADSSNYQLKSNDVGHTVRVRVTAKNADGSATVDSAADRRDPDGNRSAAHDRERLPGRYRDARRRCDRAARPAPRRWTDGLADRDHPLDSSDVTLRFHVSACSGRSISNALVYATAVPFSQFSIPPEAQTGSDGWATLTMHQDRFFPASSRQQLLAVFVRARKSGESLLGGVSTRRLVSFPVHL